MSDIEELTFTDHDYNPHELLESELYWRGLYTWLLAEGYRLRPRYDPEWTPSWLEDKKTDRVLAEDYQVATSFDFIDATRVKDDSHVVLKKLNRDGTNPPEEVDILKFFSEHTLSSDQENHCIPLLGCLEPPNHPHHVVIAMPVLRPYHDPDFDTVGEGLEFLRQVLEGFAFLHHHRVVHRDIRSENIMMDAKGIYTEKWFPWKRERKFDYSGRVSPVHTKTEHPPKYYIIDYGFSRQYREDEMPVSCVPKLQTDKTIPEIVKDPTQPCDPFPIDVYTLGNLVRMDFMDGNPEHFEQNGRRGFEFLRPLITSMTAADPNERPTMAEAASQLEDLIRGLSTSALRSRAIRIPGGEVPSPNIPQKAYQTLTYWARRFSYVARRIPPIPSAPVKKVTADAQTASNEPSHDTTTIPPETFAEAH